LRIETEIGMEMEMGAGREEGKGETADGMPRLPWSRE